MQRSDIAVRAVTSVADDPDGFAGLAVAQREVDGERDPGDPPQPDRMLASELFGSNPDRTMQPYLASVDGEPAGMAYFVTQSAPDDPAQVAEAHIDVRPAFRRRGVATALLATMVPDLVALRQGSIAAYVSDRLLPEAGTALCARFGLTKRTEIRCSRAIVADIDDDLVDGWIADAATAAADYRLVQWDGVCPDEYATRWTHAAEAMEDEPLDDFDYTPYTRSAELQRQADVTKTGHGYHIYRTLAIGPNGEAAGLTAIYVHADRPEIGHQSDTGVLAGHRGHRLGRWLKAANYRRVREAHPELRVLETYNAESNPWMLAINEAMQFRPHHVYTGFQGPIEAAVAALEG